MKLNCIPYIISIKEDIMTIKQPFKNNDHDISLHLSSNYPNYKQVSPFLFSKRDIKTRAQSIITMYPKLLEQWKQGNFIHDHDSEFEYERLSQFEYDKACYEKQIDVTSQDNIQFFQDIQYKLK
jgi:hypothetical protein